MSNTKSGLVCGATGCSSRILTGNGIKFHSFPEDDTRETWIRFCNNPSRPSWDKAKTCEKHFLPECYEHRSPLEIKMMKLSPKKNTHQRIYSHNR